ncbi:MAG: tRNA uridine-5-carboxymethylaminomethyl(34) synthesis GTPase MnmE [Gemmatimonadota bacterium]|nr:tRNA uridine-5-carboxymethylaminomethyl(34) synthesis GTPase MnmE [Gemmatimonadota bacterium]
MDGDTIISVSTAPGLGAIAMVRVSGPDAGVLLCRLASDLAEVPEPRRATLVKLQDPDDGSSLDRAVVTFYQGPASYTGENLVELTCHGGRLVPSLIADALMRAGGRQATPGEFTKRAYLRGKLDLVQVEAVADLVEARSRAMHRAALGHLERGLSRRITKLREGIVGLEAMLVHHIDFPEEDDPPVPVTRIVDEASWIIKEIAKMLRTAPEGQLLREGALTVLAGQPNVGKSSLYNALVGEERAIVTEEPGTTRDALEVAVQLGGFPFRLVDTAGLRDGGERIEQLGIEVARRYLDSADLVLLCVSAIDRLSVGELAFLSEATDSPVVLVETKIDLLAKRDVDYEGLGLPVDMREKLAGHLRVSAMTGEGLDQVKQLLPELVYSAVVSAQEEVPVLTRRRHALALEVALSEVSDFTEALADGLPAEVASTHLRAAATALEEILGVISVDDVLDAVFAEFCVGK